MGKLVLFVLAAGSIRVFARPSSYNMTCAHERQRLIRVWSWWPALSEGPPIYVFLLSSFLNIDSQCKKRVFAQHSNTTPTLGVA